MTGRYDSLMKDGFDVWDLLFVVGGLTTSAGVFAWFGEGAGLVCWGAFLLVSWFLASDR